MKENENIKKTEETNNNDKHLIQDFELSEFQQKKSFPLKYKIIIIVAVSLILISLVTLIIIIVLKEQEDPTPLIIEPKSEYKYCIIWIHGVSATPEYFVTQFTDQLHYIKKENTKIILMRAPKQYVDTYGRKTTSWFNLYCSPIDSPKCYSFGDATKSKDIIVKIIEQEAIKLNGKYQNIFIGGHSQGACMSLYTAYNYIELLGGVLACNGVLFPEAEIVGNKNQLKVFLGHGYNDMVIPMYFHNESIKRIENYEGVEKHYYEGIGHGIGTLELNDMGGFLNKSMI